MAKKHPKTYWCPICKKQVPAGHIAEHNKPPAPSERDISEPDQD